MTREECERKLIDLAAQAHAIYREYNERGNGVMISTHRDGYIGVTDIEVEQDPGNPDRNVIVNWTLDAARNQDGEIYSINHDAMTLDREGAMV